MNPVSNLLARQFCRKTLVAHLDEPIVSFTFDDIAESAVTAGARTLDEYNVSGTFYVAPGLCGSEGPLGRFASEANIKALSDRGHEIGCHTFSHVSVAALSSEALMVEVERNLKALQSITGRSELRHFAYPYGEITLSSKRWLGRSFVTMRGISPGINAGKIDLAALRAVALYQYVMDPARIDRWIARSFSSPGWLIFYTHDVSEKPSPWGISVGLFEAAVRKAVSSGAQVLNIEQACNRITHTN